MNWLDTYHKNGYHFPFDVLSLSDADSCRTQLESVENKYSNSDDLKKLAIGHANAVLPFIDNITRLPRILDPVKAILGADVLVWNASFFIKEPHSEDFISWHQDLTYWGLTDSHEVTAWIALTPSTIKSGCVKFVPGTHKFSIAEHTDTFDKNNLLSRGQALAVDIDEDAAINVVLQPGQMSLHHGQVFHGSHANQSSLRRIGLAIRYITPDMQQTTKDKTHARLVSGEDKFRHFTLKGPPNGILHHADVEALQENIILTNKFLFANIDKS